MRLFLIFLLGALIVTGCSPAAAPGPTSAPAAGVQASTPIPTEAPTATNTVAATETTAPTTMPTMTPTIESSPTAAQVETITTLSEPPQQMLWLAEGAQVAGIAEPGPLLIVRVGATPSSQIRCARCRR